MAFAIDWDQTGEKFYETGTDRGVLYPKNASGAYGPGVAWNGLTAVTENPSGAEDTKLWADNQKYLSLYSAEEFGCTIEAYTYPDEWAECDGSKEVVAGTGVYAGQQARKGFGFCYRSVLGNDELGESYGYKLHVVYGCQAAPSEKSYATINDSPEAITFSWEVTTTPVNITKISGMKPTAIFTIDAAKLKAQEGGEAKLTAIEEALYGTKAAGAAAAVEPRILLPDDIIGILNGD